MGKEEEDPEIVVRYKSDAEDSVEKEINIKSKFVVDATGKSSYPLLVTSCYFLLLLVTSCYFLLLLVFILCSHDLELLLFLLPLSFV